MLGPTPDTWYDLLARCSFDHGGRAIAMALVVVRLRPRPAPQSRQISTWGGGERGRIKKCAFLLYMSTISLHEKTPLRSLFGPPGAGRLSRPGRGPCERPSATIRHDTAIIRSRGKGPGDIVSTMSSSSRTATKSQRHLASAVCAVEGRCSSCWRHYPFLPLSECWHRA